MRLDKRKQELHEQTLVLMVEKVSLTRDRDALGAAVGVRTIPAPHATLNGAPAALAMVHCLIASRVAAIYVWLGTRGSLGIQVIHEEGACRSRRSIYTHLSTSAVRIEN